MGFVERFRQWIERQVQIEQDNLSRGKRFLQKQLRLHVFVGREIFSGEYLVRAAALVFATLLAIVPVATVSFSFFRAFGGLSKGGETEQVAQKLGDYIFGSPPTARAHISPSSAAPPADKPGEKAPPDPKGGEDAKPGEGKPTPGENPPGGKTTAEAPSAEKTRAGLDEEDKKKLERMFSYLWAERVREMVLQLVDKASGQTNVVSILLLVLSAVLLFNTIETTVNRIWRVERQRSFWVKFPAFFTILILGPVLIGVSIWFASQFRAADYVTALPNIFQHAVLWLAAGFPTTVAFFIGYSLLPYTRVRFWPAVTGAVFATVAWEVGKWGFGAYVQRAVSYSRIYGPLAAFPIFLLWLYMTWIIVLLGAGLSYITQNLSRLAELERQKRHPTPVSDRLALSMMLTIGRRFVLGQEPLDLSALAEALASRVEQVDETTRALASGGLLTRLETAGETRVLPGRSLDKVTVGDVLEITSLSNEGLCRVPDERQRAELEFLFEALEAQREEVAGQILLRDLVDRTLADREPAG